MKRLPALTWFGRQCFFFCLFFFKGLCRGWWFCKFTLQCCLVCFLLTVYKHILYWTCWCIGFCLYLFVHIFTFPFAVYSNTVRNHRPCSRQFLLSVCTLSAFKHPACTDTVKCLLTFLPVRPAHLASAKIYSFIFFYVQHWLLLLKLPSQLLPCLQQMQRMMGMVRKEQCLSMSCLCFLSRWVLVLSPCHWWRVEFGASLAFVFY